MDLTLDVIGERSVTLRFEGFTDELRAAIMPVVEHYGRQLYDAAVAAAPKKTGRLESTIDYAILEGPRSIRAVVGFTGDYGKAAAINYGSHVAVSVKPHSMKLGHVYSRAISPESVSVKAYSRRTNVEGTKFLQHALAEVAPGFLDDLKAAIDAAIIKNNSEDAG